MGERVRTVDNRGSVMVEIVHEEIPCWEHGSRRTISFMGKGSDNIFGM
jgi:hypothetical protein